MDNTRSLETRLRAVEARFSEVNERLASLSAPFDPEENKKLSKERAQLEPIVTAFEQHKAVAAELEEAEAMTRDSDQALAEMARGEVARLRAKAAELEARLRVLLVPKDPNDDKDIFIEIRAGAGGDEAGLFAGDLLRMYLKYAEAHRLKTEIISASESEAGGY
jgi:peptide chain release factor 1